NALLLPYEIKAGNLKALREVFSRLKKEGRLFVPSRSAREFGNNRDKKLGEMINAIQNRMSNAMPDSSMPPLLSESANYKDAAATHAVLIESRKKYIESLGKLISEIKSWRGNDSVTAMYTSGRLLIGRITK